MGTARTGADVSARRRRVRQVAFPVLVVAAYYLVPVFQPVAESGTLLRAAATAALLAVAAWLVGREVLRNVHAGAAAVRLDRLLLAAVAGIVVFAFADYTVAIGDEGQFVGLETRTDALYFALSTLTTVGFGDVHAAGQLARVVVSVQIVFNVAVLASAGQILWRGLAERRPADR